MSPPLSSSILDGQSLRPVHTRICSAYPVITPLSGLLWSISSPGGVVAHPHVGDGHVATVGKGAGGGGGAFGRGLPDLVARDLRGTSALWDGNHWHLSLIFCVGK